MKFIVDAQLPPSLVEVFYSKGLDAIHTITLTEGNLSTDHNINDISIKEDRILITKDSDFYHSFIIHKRPYKLLIVRVGNMKKNDLKELFQKNIDSILKAFKRGKLVELTRTNINILY